MWEVSENVRKNKKYNIYNLLSLPIPAHWHTKVKTISLSMKVAVAARKMPQRNDATTQHNVTLNVIAFHVCLVTHINSNRL